MSEKKAIRSRILTVLLVVAGFLLVVLYICFPRGGRQDEATQPAETGESLVSPLSKASITETSSSVASPIAKPDTLSYPSVDQKKEDAARNFRESWRCQNAAVQIQSLQGRIEACTPRDVSKWDARNLAACKESTKRMNAGIEEISARNSDCDSNPANVQRAYSGALKRAAELGDPDAQICFIRGRFQYNDDYSPNTLDQFRRTAMQYADAGIARGDWRVIKLLGQSSSSIAHGIGGFWLGALPIGTPYEVYRMNRLLRLGATGEFAKMLDIAKDNPALQLSEEQLAQANTWAAQTYQQYFARSPALTSDPKACAD